MGSGTGKRVVRILSVVLSVVLFVAMFWFFQRLVTPKYSSEFQPEGALVGEYYRESTAHDVLFLGDCEIYECFIPEVLWHEYGITAYDRGSPQQLIWQSYALLEEMLRKESPTLVVFNVYAMKYGTPQKEEYNRLTLDGMRLSKEKYHAVCASMMEGESALSYLFPLLRYHSRITELTVQDLKGVFFSEDPVSYSGYLMQKGIVPKTSDQEGLPIAEETLPDVCMEYLEKMRLLCEEHGVTLLLVKAPTNTWKYWWYPGWDRQIREYAEVHHVPYINFIPLADEIGINWAEDTYDAGVHLNVYGAEKLTSYFGAYLKELYSFPEKDASTQGVWDRKWEHYWEDRNEKS